MKTTNSNISNNKKNGMIKLMATAFLASALLVCKPATCGNIIPGIRVSDYVTGNQMGSNFSASLVFRMGKGSFSLGPNFQQRRPHFSGMQSSFEYDFGNPDGKASIFAFGSLIYHQSSYLGKGCVKIQNNISRETPLHCENIKLNTIEMYAGFGVNIKHSDFISSSWGIGVGMYNTTSANYQSMNLLRDKSAGVIMLKCALTFNFKRDN